MFDEYSVISPMQLAPYTGVTEEEVRELRTEYNMDFGRNNPQKLEHYRENLLLVSVNYEKDAVSTDAGYKRHECRIEKY